MLSLSNIVIDIGELAEWEKYELLHISPRAGRERRTRSQHSEGRQI